MYYLAINQNNPDQILLLNHYLDKNKSIVWDWIQLFNGGFYSRGEYPDIKSSVIILEKYWEIFQFQDKIDLFDFLSIEFRKLSIKI